MTIIQIVIHHPHLKRSSQTGKVPAELFSIVISQKVNSIFICSISVIVALEAIHHVVRHYYVRVLIQLKVGQRQSFIYQNSAQQIQIRHRAIHHHYRLHRRQALAQWKSQWTYQIYVQKPTIQI